MASAPLPVRSQGLSLTICTKSQSLCEQRFLPICGRPCSHFLGAVMLKPSKANRAAWPDLPARAMCAELSAGLVERLPPPYGVSAMAVRSCRAICSARRCRARRSRLCSVRSNRLPGNHNRTEPCCAVQRESDTLKSLQALTAAVTPHFLPGVPSNFFSRVSQQSM